MQSRVRIGISGWNYAPWRGVFYPKGLKHSSELAFASSSFSSVEVNGTFYSLQRPSSFERWYAETPPDFVFAVKGSRYITHLLRLKNVQQALANFFASGVLCLGEKLGPILWQLPPQTSYDRERLAGFFELLPRTLGEAARLAQNHDERVADRSVVSVPAALEHQALRHTCEVRHETFCVGEYVDLLRQYDIANCIADTAGRYPCFGDVTTDFAYVRLHGSTELYVSGYSPRELATWAARIRAWMAGKAPPGLRRVDGTQKLLVPRPRQVFVYFDNDAKVHAPFDAQNLIRLLKGKRVQKRAEPPEDPSLRATRAARIWLAPRSSRVNSA
ncbi:MAG TPA: DUF72 domain-containing protein [Polyangiaceae bacterium]|nr:DUF72 domain-containing protein [Polyangiaceae bacterium]